MHGTQAAITVIVIQLCFAAAQTTLPDYTDYRQARPFDGETYWIHPDPSYDTTINNGNIIKLAIPSYAGIQTCYDVCTNGSYTCSGFTALVGSVEQQQMPNATENNDFFN